MKNNKKTKIEDKVLVLSHIAEKNRLREKTPYSIDGTIKIFAEKGVKINFRG